MNLLQAATKLLSEWADFDAGYRGEGHWLNALEELRTAVAGAQTGDKFTVVGMYDDGCRVADHVVAASPDQAESISVERGGPDGYKGGYTVAGVFQGHLVAVDEQVVGVGVPSNKYTVFAIYADNHQRYSEDFEAETPAAAGDLAQRKAAANLGWEPEDIEDWPLGQPLYVAGVTKAVSIVWDAD